MSSSLPPEVNPPVAPQPKIATHPSNAPIGTAPRMAQIVSASPASCNADRSTRIPGTRGIVVRALHKSATMFLYKFFEQVAFDSKIDFFSSNHPQPTDRLVTSDIKSSFCVGPVRHFRCHELVEFHNIASTTQIFQVRDPRDMIVSEYFSFGWIHPDQQFSQRERLQRAKLQAMTIDDYALYHEELAPNLSRKRFAPLLTWLENPDSFNNTILVKYETMVTNFSSWVCDVIQPFPFRWPKIACSRYNWKFRNEFKTRGESMTHKRRITPGDHLDKLKPSTIAKVNERYESILLKLGYTI